MSFPTAIFNVNICNNLTAPKEEEQTLFFSCKTKYLAYQYEPNSKVSMSQSFDPPTLHWGIPMAKGEFSPHFYSIFVLEMNPLSGSLVGNFTSGEKK